MKHQQVFSLILLLFLINSLSSCDPTIVKNKDYWISFTDTITNECGYKNSKGDIVIALGKYERCFTDTLKTYAIVVKPNCGFVAIDRKENVLYEIFPFDNGPDYPSGGLFRIIENDKIGFADATSGQVVIQPQFDCAWPFKHAVAQVSLKCQKNTDGEHTVWLSTQWYFIDKTGKRVRKPKTTNE